MSTVAWPPIPPDQLAKEEKAGEERELAWLLSALQDTLHSLKAGLNECADLLAPKDAGSTLVLSSLRSESLKGFVTRLGTRVVKGDVHLRLPSLPPPRGQSSYKLSISTAPSAPPLVLEQLASVRTLINACLDVVDATTWTGDAHNANFIAGQLRLLHDNIQEAKQALKGGSDVQQTPWNEDPLDERIFDPPLPPTVSFHLSISEAAILLQVRTLEVVHAGHSTGTSTPNSFTTPSYSGFSIRDRLAAALGAAKPPTHDEAHDVFTYKGQDVRVKEKVRVESQDPSLLAAMAKLSALEHSVALSCRALDVVMDKDEET
ncbi:hypothetical protein H2203_005350 [Taxawa tesnikishii (nom. ined.)]|nr:hypothetical protein H2203_005350 [Dothideales sp. JES 119]